MSNVLRTMRRHSMFAAQWHSRPSKGVRRAFWQAPWKLRMMMFLMSTALGRVILKTYKGGR